MPAAAPHVLVVEDDPTVCEVLRRYLEREGHQVSTTADGIAAMDRIRSTRFDLVVLDLMLPGMDGLEVCRRLRAESKTPVIMLTALGTEADRITGLELGADDYLTKPFSPRELVLRVGSVLRRASAQAPAGGPARLVDGDLVVDAQAHTVTLAGAPLALTSREYELLVFLMGHPGRAFSRGELLEQVWGWTFGDVTTVTVHVRRLREKIEHDPGRPSRLVTVWGTGYRYDPTGAPS